MILRYSTATHIIDDLRNRLRVKTQFEILCSDIITLTYYLIENKFNQIVKHNDKH